MRRGRRPTAPAAGTLTVMTSGDGAGPAYGARDVLANRRVIVDTVLPPVAFVTVNAVAGLVAAAVTAVVLSGLLVSARLLRRQRLLYAVSGLGGVLLGVAAALWSGAPRATSSRVSCSTPPTRRRRA